MYMYSTRTRLILYVRTLILYEMIFEQTLSSVTYVHVLTRIIYD